MTLRQLSAIKRWHLLHHKGASVEIRIWDLVLMCWLVGWIGTLPSVLLSSGGGFTACMLLFMTPRGYVRLRRRLHRRGLLRCDWLTSLGRG